MRISASCCRLRGRLSRRRRLELGVYLLLGMLAACATSAPAGRAYPYRSWVEFGAAVHAFAAPEVDRAYTRAVDEHESMPDAESAVRLAILAASPSNAAQDLTRAIALLDSVAGEVPVDRDANAEFARFYRPVLAQLLETREALATAAVERAALQAQLDALKALEEQLNADAPLR